MSQALRNYTASVRSADTVIQQIQGDQWNAPTPCDEWSVREVVTHLCSPMAAIRTMAETGKVAAPEPIDASALAAGTQLLAPSLSRILTNLADRSLIERTGDPGDQRRTLLALSAAGDRLVAEVAPGSEAVYSMIEARFGADRLAGLIAELRELAELLDPEDP